MKRTHHFISVTGFHGCMPKDSAVYDDPDSAIDSMIDAFDLDPAYVVIVDRSGEHDTLIARSFVANLRQYRASNYEITYMRDLINDLRSDWYVDLPTEGTCPPVFGTEYIKITSCDCDDPSHHEDC